MAGNNSIQILRGSSSYNPNNVELLDGQPFYSKQSGKFYIGVDGNSKQTFCNEQQVDSKVSDEANLRQTADSDLQSKLNDEAALRQSADSNLQSKLDTEISRSTTFDNAHNNLENGEGAGSLKQKGTVTVGGYSGNIKARALGPASVALNGIYKPGQGLEPDSDGVIAAGPGSFAGGKDTTTYQACSFAFGGGNKAGLTEAEFNAKYSSGKDAHGKTYAESYSFATAEGVTTVATGYAAHAENESTEASGHRSHTSGQETHATGDRSFATGYKTYAEGMNSFTMGENTYAKGVGSFAQGYGGQASGNWSVKIGEHCKSTKVGSFSGGFSSESTGNYSFAFGGITDSFKNVTKATKPCAIALGCGAVASGDYQSTAIGLNVTASGNASLAMGWNSIATNLASVAIGQDCESNEEKCTTVGWGNVNNVNSALVCGRFGKAEKDTDHLFVVGGGSSKNNPANLFSVGTNITDISSKYLNVNCLGINFDCTPRVYRQGEASWHDVLLADIPTQSGNYVITNPTNMDLESMPSNNYGNLGLFFMDEIYDSYTMQTTIKYYKNNSMYQKGAIYYVTSAKDNGGDIGNGILIKFGQSTQQQVFALFITSSGGIRPGLIQGKTFTGYSTANGKTSSIEMSFTLKTLFNLPPYIC